MAAQKRVKVNATKTSFEILEGLKELDGAGVSETASYLDLPKTTVFDHLQTMEELGFVVKDAGEYRVGIRFLDLAGYARQRMDVFQVAKPEVKKLASQTGEHANLMIEEHGRGIFLYTAKGDEAVHLDTYAGHHVHLQTTALGKAILAHLSRSRVEEILEEHGMPKITDNTICDRDELFDQLETIRERGYATDLAERIEGMRCVAAPIVRQDRSVVGAISVSGPQNRMKNERFREEIPDKVLRSANVVEVNLTYS